MSVSTVDNVKIFVFVSCAGDGRLDSRSRLVVIENRSGDLRVIGGADVPVKATVQGSREVREVRSRIAEAARKAGYTIPESLDGKLNLHHVNRHESFFHVLGAQKAMPRSVVDVEQ